MIITPPLVPPSYDVPTQVQLISDSEFKKRISNVVLCAETTNKTILRVAADHDGIYSHWIYANPITCEGIPAVHSATHAEYSQNAFDAQDILEKYNPVSNYNHTFTKNNNLLPVPSLINDKLNWSDFPSIESNVAIQPYIW